MERVIMDEIPELTPQVEEAYKTLRTNIQFSGEDIKTISFTSCIPNEGKSIVTLQLAKSMAELGKKVLFLDADIRGSVMGSRFNVRGAVDEFSMNNGMMLPSSSSRYGKIKIIHGLTEYLTGQCTLEQCIYRSNIEEMDLVFTGMSSPNPSELLGGERFQEMLKIVREAYDYVFIDCPPLGSVIDAAVVSAGCDGAVLIIESEAISYKLAQRVQKQLESSGCKILGAVLNKASIKSGSYYAKNYGKYYGHYYNKKRRKS